VLKEKNSNLFVNSKNIYIFASVKTA